MNDRCAVKSDLPAMLAIERQSFPRPWHPRRFNRLLKCRRIRGRVIEERNGIIGYVIYEFAKSHIEILNLAVDPTRRREGIGSALLDGVKLNLRKFRRICWLTVSESNLTAQLFFRDQNFFAVDIIRKPFHDCDEDGYLMEHLPVQHWRDVDHVWTGGHRENE